VAATSAEPTATCAEPPASSEAATSQAPAAVACTFCLKRAADVQKMVAGPGVFICNECVGLCAEIIASEAAAEMPKPASWEERVSDDDLLATLPKIAAASASVEQQLGIWVRQARSRQITWTRIGAAMGMTRQSAWERFSGEE
jgi:ATP-dependent Clp protease ATP-binding subunit ClpX